MIGIDEIQFFDTKIIKICNSLANNGKRVIAAGLDKDFLTKPFGPMPLILTTAEYVTKLYAICVGCGNHAHFTKRISNEGNQVVVGEKDKYEARCRTCYNKE